MIVKYPLSTEKSIRLMESENKLIFIVDEKATKQEIKQAIEKTFDVQVVQVRTLNDSKGRKRAYITFSPETPAIDLATKLGLM
jgi:ribosomal protein uL23